MSNRELIPYDGVAQRSVTRAWDATLRGSVPLSPTRPLVRDSWLRSLQAAVPADLPRAPLVLADASLHAAQERADWIPFALRATDQLNEAFSSGHVLSLFDADGRMLSCEGDPAVLEGLAAINFRPGALWTEGAVGTNGPGTALATNRAVHIVGAEHFCEAWHGWHCAAVPIADHVTRELLGVIDISGFSSSAHPHTLQLAVALASSVREMLASRDLEWRCAVLKRFAALSWRYVQDGLVAIDRRGVVLSANDRAPAGLRPGTQAHPALQKALAEHARGFARHAGPNDTSELFLSLGHDIGLAVVSHPVVEQGRVVGACLVLQGGAAVRGAARPALPSPMASGDADTRLSLQGIAGTAPAMAESLRIAIAASTNTLPVLLLGESGTGKEVFAQAIHRASDRSDRPFVAVNCAALPHDLVEAELFGYIGGAFTGARREGSPGKFRAADGGTIFLDEISEMPYGAQAALLRVLQEQEVTAVGSTNPTKVNVRVMAATNRDVQEAISAGVLREDLYHRLNVLGIELPPLRERLADIPVLAGELIREASAELNRPQLRFDHGVLAVLAAHDWPGNVRELKNVVRRAAALCRDECIRIDDVSLRSAGYRRPVARPVRMVEAVDDRALTVSALMAARTMADAATRLGINRSTLYRRLERYGLKAERLLRAH